MSESPCKKIKLGAVERMRKYRTKKLDIQSCNGAMGERAISVCGPKLWNALPRGMRVETCTDVFKKSLKTFLFSDVERFYETVYRK